MSEKSTAAHEEFSEKTILLVNTGSIKKRFILQQLKKLGLTIVVLNKEKNWAQPYVDQWILADTGNFKESIQAIREFLKSHSDIKIDGALTFWEDDVLLTAKITDTFNMIGIPFPIAQKARNKFLFREFCEANGIRAPRHFLLKSSEDCKQAAQALTFPLVIKPAYGASSAYVVKVEDEEDLYNTFEYIQKNISTDIESALVNGFDILVEEYIDGDEVDIDILLQNGKIKFYSITDNFQTREPFFVETGDAIPSSLPPWEQKQLVELAEEVLEKLEIQTGCIHFEAKATKTGPVPIEVNLRMGGDYVYSFIRESWGVDMIENAVKIACGIYIKHIPKPERPLKFLAGKYFIPEYSGILARLEVDEKAKSEAHLEEMSFYKKVGDPILVPPEGFEFVGWFTVSGSNPIDAQDNARAMEKNVVFEVARFNHNSFIGRTSRKNRFSVALLNKDNLLRTAKRENIKRVSVEEVRNLNIGIAYNTYGEQKTPAEEEKTEPARAIGEDLRGQGYQVGMFDANNATEFFEHLRASDVNLVMNVGAEILDSRYGKINAAALLDMLDIPYTGSDSSALNVCRDISRIKKLLNFHGIPTPRWDYAYSLDDPIREDLIFPVIVKPMYSDSPIGITHQSVVTDKKALMDAVKKMIVENETPVIIEEFIDGDEYHAAILGNDVNVRVLPLSRTIFQNSSPGVWPMFGTDEPEKLTQCPPKNISKKLESLLTEIALDAYSVLECQDYGEVKIRVDKDYNPYVIGVDLTPYLAADRLLARTADMVGMPYGDFIEEIIRIAIARYKNE